jgi:hypothetical protein
MTGNAFLNKIVSWAQTAYGDGKMTRRFVAPGALAVSLLLLGLSGCTNPYDPGQRALGGGLIGAGSGAAIGGAAGGGRGAAIGAATGGAVGAITGAATTPPPPRY